MVETANKPTSQPTNQATSHLANQAFKEPNMQTSLHQPTKQSTRSSQPVNYTTRYPDIPTSQAQGRVGRRQLDIYIYIYIYMYIYMYTYIYIYISKIVDLCFYCANHSTVCILGRADEAGWREPLQYMYIHIYICIHIYIYICKKELAASQQGIGGRAQP